MTRFLTRSLAAFGLMALLGSAAAAMVAYRLLFSTPTLPETIVLRFDFQQELSEVASNTPLPRSLVGSDTTVRDVVEALDRARSDHRVKGLVAKLGGDGLGLAKSQELRAAIERFRASGRFALAYADSLGEFGPGNQAYYLASAFEQIWLQPIGLVGLTGLSAEVPFAREALDMAKVEPAFGHREEYKSAVESLTERGLTKPHRAMLESLLDDLTGQLVAGIAEGRKLEPAAVRALIDRGPLLAKEAVEAKLIDRLGYWDEVLDEAVERAEAKGSAGVGVGVQAGAEAVMVELEDYLDAAGSVHEKGPQIALIYGVGAITSHGGNDPLSGGGGVSAKAMVRALEAAADDDDVRAIVVRLDSPGGSPSASETIRRALVRAREAGKPVIVSMAGTAASGGYWVAMNADRIIAEPATLTGSIGVFAGKIVTGGLWQRLGVSWERVGRSRNASIWSATERYDQRGRERLEAMLDDIYDGFLQRVAEARRMTPEAVRAVAKGRVWTGAQAVKLGLVDELGDLELAVQRAAEAAGLGAQAAVTLQPFPRPRSTLEKLLDLLDGEAAGSGQANALVMALNRVLEPLAPLLAETGPGPQARMSAVGRIR
ncbi:Protease 4 [uncultured Gammaproteobacteria bacterium]